MPIYEFKCPSCGHEFEELVSSLAAAHHVPCIQCGKPEVERLISQFGFASKGSSGETVRSSSSGHSCSGCASHNCGNCH